MKLKHIILPFYLCLVLFCIWQCFFITQWQSISTLDIVCILFLEAQIVLVLLFIFEKIFTHWNKKI